MTCRVASCSCSATSTLATDRPTCSETVTAPSAMACPEAESSVSGASALRVSRRTRSESASSRPRKDSTVSRAPEIAGRRPAVSSTTVLILDSMSSLSRRTSTATVSMPRPSTSERELSMRMYMPTIRRVRARSSNSRCASEMASALASMRERRSRPAP